MQLGAAKRRLFMVWGPIIMAGASLLGNVLSNRSANKRARNVSNTVDEIPQIGTQYLTPFIDRGAQASQAASGAYSQMLQNPTAFVDQIMASYKPSAGYDFRRKNALDAARNSAAAGGFSGTQYDQMQQAALADNLLGQDMQQYLQNILGVHNTGLAGQQRFADQGLDAAASLADYLGSATGARAGLQFQQNQQRSRNNAGLMGQLTGLLNTQLPTRMPPSGETPSSQSLADLLGSSIGSVWGGFK